MTTPTPSPQPAYDLTQLTAIYRRILDKYFG